MFSLGIVFEEEVAAKERAVFMGHHLALSLEAVAAWPQDVVEHPRHILLPTLRAQLSLPPDTHSCQQMYILYIGYELCVHLT